MMNVDEARQLTRDLKEIFRRLDDLETSPVSVTGGAVPAPVAQGDTLHADATPAWALLSHPGGAGYAYTTDGVDVLWDQTPLWTGQHSFNAGIAMTGASAANDFIVPDNTTVAFELEDAGGLEYLRLDTRNAQPIIIFNNAAADIDFHVQANGVADALQVRGSDGQITLGALGAGFVQSDAGGVLSSAAIVAGDLPAHTHSGAAQGGSLVIGTTDTDATLGSILFAGAGGSIQEDNTNLFWDDTNNVLGIRSNAPAASAEGLYVPWIAGDVRTTSYFGSTNASNNQHAIRAASYSGNGVYATSVLVPAIYGEATAASAGVQGSSLGAGTGVFATSATGKALVVNLTGAGTTIAEFLDTGVIVWSILDGGTLLCGATGDLDLNGVADALILDADGDTTISAPTDDQIDIEIAGADDFTFTVNSFDVLTGSYITMADSAWIGLGAAKGRLIFDDAVTDAIILADGVLDLNGIADALVLDADGDTSISAPTANQIDFECGGVDGVTMTSVRLAVTQEIGHIGDTDTYMEFPAADQWRLYCGGIQMIDAVEAASDYLNLHAGLVGINETSNANMSIGLTADQGANDDEILNFRSSDVGAVSSSVETGTWLTIAKHQGAAGGAAMRGFKDSDAGNYAALFLTGFLEEDTDVVKTTAARGITEIWGLQTDGTSSENTVANGNVLVVRTQRGGSTVTTHWFDEDGDFGYDGSLVPYDNLADEEMARDLQLVLTGRKGVRYNQQAMVDAGILYPSEYGRVMVSHKRMTALQLGAHAQAYDDRRRLEARIEYLEQQLKRMQ